jgi:argininosuccinate lyase
MESLSISELLVKGIKPNKENMLKHITNDMFATHYAYQLVEEEDIPFRIAYQKVGKNLDKIPDFDPQTVLKQTISLGSAGNLKLSDTKKQIKDRRLFWTKKQQEFKKVIKQLLQPEK